MDGTGLRGVLVDGLEDLRVSLFLLTEHSIYLLAGAIEWGDPNFEFEAMIRMQ